MTTFTGNQIDFLDALKDLVELEYDTKEAYEEAIKKISNENYKVKLSEFYKDHERHIIELSKILQNHNEQAPTKPSAVKSFITKGKVVVAEIIGDKTILYAMASNEIDTNLAYERINARHDVWDDAKEIVRLALKDEKKHKKWLDDETNQ